MSLATCTLADEQERLRPLLPQVRAEIEKGRLENGEFVNGNGYLDMATIEVAEGNLDEVVPLVRAWEQASADDWSERILGKDVSCGLYALAKAADAAVDCLREAFREPSYAMPFLEPYLPFYDRIRAEPAFIALVEELESAQ